MDLFCETKPIYLFQVKHVGFTAKQKWDYEKTAIINQEYGLFTYGKKKFPVHPL